MIRSRRLSIAILVVALTWVVPVAVQAQALAPEPEVPDGRIRLDKSQLPVAELLPSWVLTVGISWTEREREGDDVKSLLGQYGLDPESPAARMLLDIHDRYWERFPASELARRYEESTAPEEVVMRRWSMERARFLGREIGAWFAALESEGMDTAALVQTIRTTPYYASGKTIEADKVTLQKVERELIAFHEEFRKAFGGPFPTEEVPR